MTRLTRSSTYLYYPPDPLDSQFPQAYTSPIHTHHTAMSLKRHTFHLEEEQVAALQGIQERTGVPTAWQIREAIDMYLKSKDFFPLPKDPRQLELDLT